MKSMMKVLSRYVLSAAAVAVLLLVINATVLIVWLFTEKNDKNYYNISPRQQTSLPPRTMDMNFPSPGKPSWNKTSNGPCC